MFPFVMRKCSPNFLVMVIQFTILCGFWFLHVTFVSWRPRRPQWGSTDGAECIFGFCRTRVGCGPASGPNFKKPCAVLVRWWDEEQIKHCKISISCTVLNGSLFLPCHACSCITFSCIYSLWDLLFHPYHHITYTYHYYAYYQISL